MTDTLSYPRLTCNLSAIRDNAGTVSAFLHAQGIRMAGVVKFSDGSVPIARAYWEGGCDELASSRIAHLRELKAALPAAKTMLIRIPMPSEAALAVQFADVSLNSDRRTLCALNEAAAAQDRIHKVALLLDVGDRREGVADTEELLSLALFVENECPQLHLMGVGATYACISGVLPSLESLTALADAAELVEKRIGRELEIVSGGSSVNMCLLHRGLRMPERINHLRMGGFVANPISMRLNRGVTLPGMREDTFLLSAEVVEVYEKTAPTGASGKNWAGNPIAITDTGVRNRAIVALGSQDVGDSTKLIPLPEGVRVVGSSSDHTVLDVTDCPKRLQAGDVLRFRLLYMPLLYAFSTRHVGIQYITD